MSLARHNSTLSALYFAEKYGDGTSRCTTPDHEGRYRMNCPVHRGDGGNCLVWEKDNGHIMFKCCTTPYCPSSEIIKQLPEFGQGPPQKENPSRASEGAISNSTNSVTENTHPFLPEFKQNFNPAGDTPTAAEMEK